MCLCVRFKCRGDIWGAWISLHSHIFKFILVTRRGKWKNKRKREGTSQKWKNRDNNKEAIGKENYIEGPLEGDAMPKQMPALILCVCGGGRLCAGVHGHVCRGVCVYAIILMLLWAHYTSRSEKIDDDNRDDGNLDDDNHNMNITCQSQTLYFFFKYKNCCPLAGSNL